MSWFSILAIFQNIFPVNIFRSKLYVASFYVEVLCRTAITYMYFLNTSFGGIFALWQREPRLAILRGMYMVDLFCKLLNQWKAVLTTCHQMAVVYVCNKNIKEYPGLHFARMITCVLIFMCVTT